MWNDVDMIANLLLLALVLFTIINIIITDFGFIMLRSFIQSFASFI